MCASDLHESDRSESMRFGDYAIALGYCTSADVNRAVKIQKDLINRGHPHMLIGLVMVRYGIIDAGQLIDVLKTLERQEVTSLVAD
ncbi:MAG: hypothetical protein DHS20C16_33080 [Phycisphaerae bacterium]|nr:MAG: hypothetical protein DHS20C16_33080 [Phycisphaerae bacterium]